MTIEVLRRFAASRRSAIAITFAASLLPLMFLVGIATDFIFLSQARTQATFAAQAAAVHAVRIADSTFALEMAHNCTGCSDTVPTAHAKAAANNAGDAWFSDVLGNLSFATISSAPYTNTTSTNDTASPPNFTATVTYSFKYPPIFDPLFGNPTTTWTYSSGATATSQFAYAEILMMLDTSGSMLIGANPSDISTMEQNSVCPPYGYYIPLASDGNNTAALYPLSYSSAGQGYDANPTSSDGKALDLTTASNYPAKSSTDISEQCNSGYGVGANHNTSYPAYLSNVAQSSQNPTTPAVDCAFACHFTTNKASDGYYGDLYGMARRKGVTLRLDTVLSATENVISDMINDEAVNGQFSVGIFQFNADVLPLVTSSQGGGYLPEASSSLSTALTTIQQKDYNVTKTENVFPLLTEGNATYSTTNFDATPELAHADGLTNFVQSMTDLVAGDASPTSSSGALQPLGKSGNGATTTTPEKFMFIVTDGLEDSNPDNGGGEGTSVYGATGEMTSVAAEAAGTGTCSALKNLGFTVYVLYITYYPIDDNAFYAYLSNIGRYPDAATVKDNSTATSANTSIQSLVEVPSIASTVLDANGNSERYSTSPDGLALQACASSPSDFYTASSSSDIQTALNKMLKSALASTTRLTN